MRVLIAGATEFFAPFIADDLLARRHEIAVLGDTEFDFGEAARLDPAEGLGSAVASWRPEAVVDMRHDSAARAEEVLSASRGARTIHLSSAVVYGANPVCPIDETTELAQPGVVPAEVGARTCPELAERVEADQVVLSAMAQGAPATILRMPHLYGPRDPRCAEWFFTKRVLDERKRVAVPDGGLAICHRGFVQNMARGAVQALTTAKSAGQVYNLGEEKLYTLAQLARAVANALDYKWDIYSVPGHLWPTPYDHTAFYDLRKARGHLRYRDLMIPRDGLELTIGWLCQSPPEDWSWPGIDAPFDYTREDALIEQCGHKLDV
ncbi:MAG: NAD-dependent epimerase/dehydratase family protein [Armatimonadota bacterium]